MEKMDNYIDDLFRQKLSGAKAPVTPSGTEWMQLSKTIRWKKFIHFSPASFNIYYLAAAVGGLAITGAIVLPNVIADRPDKNSSQQVNTVADTLSNQETIAPASDTVFEATPEMFVPIKEKPKHENRCIDEIPAKKSEAPANPSASEATVQDSAKSDVQNVVVTNSSPPTTEAVKTDTVIKVDTVRIQKKGIQFKRKKPVL